MVGAEVTASDESELCPILTFFTFNVGAASVGASPSSSSSSVGWRVTGEDQVGLQVFDGEDVGGDVGDFAAVG